MQHVLQEDGKEVQGPGQAGVQAVGVHVWAQVQRGHLDHGHAQHPRSLACKVVEGRVHVPAVDVTRVVQCRQVCVYGGGVLLAVDVPGVDRLEGELDVRLARSDLQNLLLQ